MGIEFFTHPKRHEVFFWLKALDRLLMIFVDLMAWLLEGRRLVEVAQLAGPADRLGGQGDRRSDPARIRSGAKARSGGTRGDRVWI